MLCDYTNIDYKWHQFLKYKRNIFNMKKSKMKFSWDLVCILLVLVFLSSCKWETIEPVEVELPPIDQPISFANDIQPIFNSKCTGCHPSMGGLDLTAANSYNELINSGLVNTTTAAESEIYTKPDPHGNHSGKYSVTEAALLLRWIEEGAQNN